MAEGSKARSAEPRGPGSGSANSQPILVGVAQLTHRPESQAEALPALQAMQRCAQRAAEDAGSLELLSKADAIHVVNVLSWPSPDSGAEGGYPAALAEAIGAHPTLREYTAVGGHSPQWLVNRAADNLAAGRSRIALIAGAEMMRSARLTQGAFPELAAALAPAATPLVGDSRVGSHPIEQAHRADLPVRVYPLIETALRAAEGASVAEHRAALGQFAADFSRVAARNPHAWSRRALSAAEALDASADNRMISFPYTKRLCAAIHVDQAAALIMTTVGTARALGIPPERWVYLHGGQDAHDIWYLSHRPNLADSPAVTQIVHDALNQAQLSLDAITAFDFYSCFPCMPRIYRRALGLPDDDRRPQTLTGGLPYFGGPGSNYSMHAIATAVDRCREDVTAKLLVTANGWYCTKHACGIYSAEPAPAWARTDPARFQRALSLPPALELDPEPGGRITVDGYTVWHNREGQPETGIVCGRTPAGQRAWALTVPDSALLEAMEQSEWVGRQGKLVGRDGEANLVSF